MSMAPGCPASTRNAGESWMARCPDGGMPATAAWTDATRPSGGCFKGTRARSSKRCRSCSNSARAAGFPASWRSSSAVSSGVASPSSTACINGCSSVKRMRCSFRVSQQDAQALARLEQARLHRLLVDVEDVGDFGIAELGEMPERHDDTVPGGELHQRLLDAAAALCSLQAFLGPFGAGSRQVHGFVQFVFAAAIAHEVECLVERD